MNDSDGDEEEDDIIGVRVDKRLELRSVVFCVCVCVIECLCVYVCVCVSMHERV